MRELTFKGFLLQYVKNLSMQDTNSLYKLSTEAATENPRLREPLLLYALLSQKHNLLLSATKDTELHTEYHHLLYRYTAEDMLQLLKDHSSALPEGYHKVWNSYLNRKNKGQADDHTKTLMRNKVKHLQAAYGISNYRIYTDLKLNPGNLNAWLKHGDCSKVSLETARSALKYVQNYA